MKMPVVTHVTWHEAENARAAKAQAKTIMEASEHAAIVQRYETELRKKQELDARANAVLWLSPFSKKFRHSIHCPKHIATRAAVLQHRLCRDQAPKTSPEAIYSSSSKTPPGTDDPQDRSIVDRGVQTLSSSVSCLCSEIVIWHPDLFKTNIPTEGGDPKRTPSTFFIAMPQSEAGRRARASGRDDLDEDIDADCTSVMSRAVSRGCASSVGKRSRISGASKKSRVQASEVDAPMLAEENPMCGLCETPIDEDEDGGVENKFQGFLFHKRCFNAVRCRRRQLVGQDKKDFDANMVSYPWDFRQQVLPLVVKKGMSMRDAGARRMAKFKTVKSKHVIKDNVKQKRLLSRAGFYRYHRQWDGWDRDKSNAVFDQKLSQQLGVQYYFMFYSVWKFVDLTIDICLSLLHVFQKSTCVCRKLQKCR